MYLEEVIDDIQLENDKFECKSKLNRDDVVGWLKTIAGFANAQGGEFYIGVEDKTNKLIGFDRVRQIMNVIISITRSMNIWCRDHGWNPLLFVMKSKVKNDF